MAVVSCQNYPDMYVGFPYYTGYTRTLTMDSATPTVFAYSFVVPNNPFSSGDLKFMDFRWYCSTATGSPKTTAYLLADVNGVPDILANALATGNEITIAGAGWITQTFTAYKITAGTQYWVAIKCTSGTSAVITTQDSNSVYSGVPANYTVGSIDGLWRARGDSGTGAAWAGTDRAATTGVRVGLTNDTDTAYFGFPLSAATAQNGATYKVESTIEPGVVFTIPANASLSVKSVGFFVRKSGTPGDLSLKLYTGDATTATATSNAVPVANIAATTQIIIFDFATAQTLTGGTKYRFVLSAASGDGSNYYYTYTSTMDSDSVAGGTVNLIPGSAGLCKLASGSWTDTATEVPTLGLLLNTAGRFVSTGSGGGRPAFGDRTGGKF